MSKENKYILDETTISCNFREEQIEHYMKEHNFTRLESLLYLWAFNNFSTNSKEVTTDLGRPMYRKLARKLANLFKGGD